MFRSYEPSCWYGLCLFPLHSTWIFFVFFLLVLIFLVLIFITSVICTQMITLGGDAELELVDSLDPFSEGVVFSVRPPKKSWKNIANLSGGEKVLTRCSLFSIKDPIVPVGHIHEMYNVDRFTACRLWAHWLLFLPCTTTSLPLFMWWMKSMLR